MTPTWRNRKFNTEQKKKEGPRRFKPEGKKFDPQNPQSRKPKSKKEKEEEYLRIYGANVWELLNKEAQERNKLSFTSPRITRMYTPYRPLYRNEQKTSMKESSILVKPTDVRKRKLQLD